MFRFHSGSSPSSSLGSTAEAPAQLALGTLRSHDGDRATSSVRPLALVRLFSDRLRDSPRSECLGSWLADPEPLLPDSERLVALRLPRRLDARPPGNPPRFLAELPFSGLRGVRLFLLRLFPEPAALRRPLRRPPFLRTRTRRPRLFSGERSFESFLDFFFLVLRLRRRVLDLCREVPLSLRVLLRTDTGATLPFLRTQRVAQPSRSHMCAATLGSPGTTAGAACSPRSAAGPAAEPSSGLACSNEAALCWLGTVFV